MTDLVRWLVLGAWHHPWWFLFYWTIITLPTYALIRDVAKRR